MKRTKTEVGERERKWGERGKEFEKDRNRKSCRRKFKVKKEREYGQREKWERKREKMEKGWRKGMRKRERERGQIEREGKE